ncbi:molybdopterin converting factor subunit 1 [Thermoflavimicrobium dichotomicum]|uniref:Molybdopterin synthase sulfur carrier subunit n=1 Tax=Thermoflavimicrobium dichotomicum TaxID=46223 RepID=A0A1I3Q736_9BACL|nr:molybdopterin converting factor subunit 1 [Thermoflavimicrobium dichotomicum]SFJ29863.1 molybdopterin synthase catalytic subunit/molybdopterin synthase sulfur carrier subunit [Thermoflavimicrobium dichotomicum]
MEKLKILCFANLGEKIGKFLEIPVETELTVHQLRERIIKSYPQHQHTIEMCMIAVNHEYVTEETIIRKDDQIALIPPVSGG